jgi:hypothetical protein
MIYLVVFFGDGITSTSPRRENLQCRPWRNSLSLVHGTSITDQATSHNVRTPLTVVLPRSVTLMNRWLKTDYA